MDNIEQVKQILLEHGYEYKQILGQGGFSCVLLCHSLKYKFDFAVKRTAKNRLTIDEYNTLIALNHPHIIKLYDAFEDESSQYLVMEYCQNGTIKQKEKLNYEQFIYYARQLLDALSYCHLNKIAHRDIKPENILFDRYENCKLADFGIAKYFDIDKSDEKCGTIRYFAPEMFQNEEICPFKADIWALGITFFCMATGRYPFQHKSKRDLKQNILIGELNFSKYNVDKRIRFLILKMVQVNPNLRQSPDKLLSLSMFSQSTKKLTSPLDHRNKHITSTRSMTFDAEMNSISNEYSQGSTHYTSLNSCKCISLFHSTTKTDKHYPTRKPI